MTTERPIRVLVAKPGLDGHDRGAKVVALGLRDEGMEVIYTGLRQTPDKIASAAQQEDVDVVGLSSLAGGHKYLFPKVVELLREKGLGNVLVIGGGNIPPEDIPLLKKEGVSEIFAPGTFIKDIADWIRKNINAKASPAPKRQPRAKRS